jgi:hypothetical protein
MPVLRRDGTGYHDCDVPTGALPRSKEAIAAVSSGCQGPRGQRQELLGAADDLPWSVLLHSMCAKCPHSTVRAFFSMSSAVSLFLVSPALACQGLRQAAAYIPTASPVNLFSCHPRSTTLDSQLAVPRKILHTRKPFRKHQKNSENFKLSSSGLRQRASLSQTFSRLPRTRSVSFTPRLPSDRGSSVRACLPACSSVWTVLQLLSRLHLFVATRLVASR